MRDGVLNGWRTFKDLSGFDLRWDQESLWPYFRDFWTLTQILVILKSCFTTFFYNVKAYKLSWTLANMVWTIFNIFDLCRGLDGLFLKGVFAKNERGYRLNAIKKRFWSLLVLLLSVASKRRKLLKTSHTE